MSESNRPEDRSEAVSHGREKLERLLNIKIPVIALMGHLPMKVGQVLNLSVGSVIQLDKSAEEPLLLMVNDQVIGRGEAVRIGEQFGIRILELGSVKDTIRKLGTRSTGSEEPSPESGSAGPDATEAPR